jgi:heme-degrading monooxygenase HmoA
MHAVVVNVTVTDTASAEEELRSRVVPSVAQSPGFVAGYWTRSGDGGLSMTVWETEAAARQMAERVPQNMPEFVTLEHVEVREVVASA